MDKEQETISLEEAFKQLEEMIGALESREITLEESFQKYQQGMNLLKICNEKIDKVEKKMLVINENGDTDEF